MIPAIDLPFNKVGVQKSVTKDTIPFNKIHEGNGACWFFYILFM